VRRCNATTVSIPMIEARQTPPVIAIHLPSSAAMIWPASSLLLPEPSSEHQPPSGTPSDVDSGSFPGTPRAGLVVVAEDLGATWLAVGFN